MDIAFRVDASLAIGNGHVVRCLTLAKALQEIGARCMFICRAHDGNLISHIREHDFHVEVLLLFTVGEIPYPTGADNSPEHNPLLGCRWDMDANETLAALPKRRVDWLIIDHYGIDVEWERFVRPFCTNLMVIDDLASRPHECDLLLDQNTGRSYENYSSLVNHARILLGPKYALIRPEFAKLRAKSLARRARAKLRNLLVTMGGVDKYNTTECVLDVLELCFLPRDLLITVVMGPNALWLKEVRRRAARMSRRTRIVCGVKDMAQLMSDSDLVIGGAGVTALERCSLGVPSLTIVLADNQLSAAGALKSAGATYVINDITKIRNMLPSLLDAVEPAKNLARMSKRSSKICDGQGVNRVLNKIVYY